MFRSRSHQLVVTSHRPGRRWLEILLWVLAILFFFLVGFFWGSGFLDNAVLENHRMTSELQQLRAEEKELRQQFTNVQLASNVDRGSLEQVRKLVTSLQLQLAANEEELRLYRNLMQPGGSESGLQIGELMLKSLGDGQGASYRIVIQQKDSKLKTVKINLKVELEGARNGIKETLSLDQLDENVGTSPVAVKFKYFHMLEGVLTLPVGFEPRAIKVSVWKTNAGANAVERRFDWHLDEA